MNLRQDDLLPPQVRGLRRALYLSAAAVLLGIGLLGVLLPGLPTTPFLLLMSYFLLRSSPWLHARVLRLPVVGRAIHDWRERGGVRSRTKILAYGMVLGVVGMSLVSPSTQTCIKVAIVVLALIGVGVVWRLPTLAE